MILCDSCGAVAFAEKPLITGPKDILGLVADMRDFTHEEVRVVYLDTRNRVLEVKTGEHRRAARQRTAAPRRARASAQATLRWPHHGPQPPQR